MLKTFGRFCARAIEIGRDAVLVFQVWCDVMSSQKSMNVDVTKKRFMLCRVYTFYTWNCWKRKVTSVIIRLIERRSFTSNVDDMWHFNFVNKCRRIQCNILCILITVASIFCFCYFFRSEEVSTLVICIFFGIQWKILCCRGLVVWFTLSW